MSPRIALAAAVALVTALTVTSAVGLTVVGSAAAVPGAAVAAPESTPDPTRTPPPTAIPDEPVPDLPASPTAAPRPTPTPTPTPAQAQAPTPATLRAAMLRTGDIGSGWRAEPVPPAPDEARSVCGGSGLAAAFPDAQRAGAALSSGAQRVQEAVSVFADTAVAATAFAFYSTGLRCSRGVIGSSKVAVSAGTDVTGRTAADSATSWTLTAQNTTIVIVSARSGRHVVNLAVLGPAGKKGADAVGLARKAVARLSAI